MVGVVGSGKSSLLSALLGEMDKVSGTVSVKVSHPSSVSCKSFCVSVYSCSHPSSVSRQSFCVTVWSILAAQAICSYDFLIEWTVVSVWESVKSMQQHCKPCACVFLRRCTCHSFQTVDYCSHVALLHSYQVCGRWLNLDHSDTKSIKLSCVWQFIFVHCRHSSCTHGLRWYKLEHLRKH